MSTLKCRFIDIIDIDKGEPLARLIKFLKLYFLVLVLILSKTQDIFIDKTSRTCYDSVVYQKEFFVL